MHGEGIFKYAVGGFYKGQFQDDKRHGRGVLKFASGGNYDGMFQVDKKHGKVF